MSETYQITGTMYTLFDDEGAVIYQDGDFDPVRVDDPAADPSWSVVHAKQGSRTKKAVMHDGILHGEVVELDSNSGAILSRCFYHDGLLHGPALTFFPDGPCASVCLYVHGKKEGISLFFSNVGKVVEKGRYRGGKKEGLQQWYFDNEMIRLELSYHEGLLTGKALSYYNNGELGRETGFSLGKRHGFDTMWDHFGTVIFSFEYLEGKCVGRPVSDPIATRYELL